MLFHTVKGMILFMKIGFFGDIHENYNSFLEFLSKLSMYKKIDIAIQTGDFGLSFKNLNNINFETLTIPLYVIDGNHEDFNLINKPNGLVLINELKKSNFFYQRRGSVINIDGNIIGFLGGALNVDKKQKVLSGNVITNDNVNRAITDFNLFEPDIIVTHSCPSGIGIGLKGNPEHGFGIYNYIVMEGYDPGPNNDVGESELTRLWKNLKTKPKHWIFGHFHQFHQTKLGDTSFSCLPAFKDKNNFIIFDTQYGNISIEIIQLY